MPDVRLVELGKAVGPIPLVRIGHKFIQTLEAHRENLLKVGWTDERTESVRQAWREWAESQEASNGDAGQIMSSLEEAAVVAETRDLIRHLHEVLRQISHLNPAARIDLQAFSISGHVLHTASGLFTYLAEILPLVRNLDDQLRVFRHAPDSRRLESAVGQLSAFLAPGQHPIDEAPAESMRGLELKGRLVSLLREVTGVLAAAGIPLDEVGGENDLSCLLPDAEGPVNRRAGVSPEPHPLI